MNSRIPILLSSCDAYSELWPVVLKAYSDVEDRNKYIITNRLDVTGADAIKVGNLKHWSNEFIAALKILKEKGYNYVFTSFEDLIPLEDLESFLNIAEDVFLKSGVDSMRCVHKPYKPRKLKSHGIFDLTFGVEYRTTCVFSFWRIDSLLKIVERDENPWQFEKNSSKRSRHLAVCIYQHRINYTNLIIQGRLNRRAARLLKVDLSFPKMSYLEWGAFELRYLLFRTSKIFRNSWVIR